MGRKCLDEPGTCPSQGGRGKEVPNSQHAGDPTGCARLGQAAGTPGTYKLMQQQYGVTRDRSSRPSGHLSHLTAFNGNVLDFNDLTPSTS